MLWGNRVLTESSEARALFYLSDSFSLWFWDDGAQEEMEGQCHTDVTAGKGLPSQGGLRKGGEGECRADRPAHGALSARPSHTETDE